VGVWGLLTCDMMVKMEASTCESAKARNRSQMELRNYFHPAVSNSAALSPQLPKPCHNYILSPARKVIISIPSPAYKDIQFDPPLPHQRQIYTTSTRYGCFVKFICLFKAPFWRSQGACGLAQSFRGPVNHCRDTSVDADENYALTCFLCSEQGRRWLALNSSDRRDAVLYQLGSLFGVGYDVVRFEFIGSMTSEWPQDRWAGWGCPFPVTPPGVIGGYGDGQLAMEKCDGLYFVGTEFTDEWRGYMEGALRSGKRGAAQALQDLRM
jgi:monoamine oxidase